MEFATSLQTADRGEFETYLIGWTGRVDPDGKPGPSCLPAARRTTAGTANPEVDKLLDAARVEQDVAKRRELYAQVWQIALRKDRSRFYLYHPK